jgi:UDPglucose 6-dehydrogenase
MNVTIIGTGYVGLVSGVCLALKGHNVICVDTNSEIVKKLNEGEVTIYEKDLKNILKKTIAAKKFYATTNLGDAIKSANIVIVAVGTPSKNGKINLNYIKKVSQDIGRYIAKLDRFISVIIKSTVIPGTTDTLVRNLIEKFSSKKLGNFGLGMNPEFLREGSAIDDFMNPDRIILGYETEKTLLTMKELYKPWNVDKITVNSRTAELIKYTNNMILAVQISTINEIANLASALGGVDIMDVVESVKLDKRWNPIINGSRSNPEILNYLIPGCGFGGSCFPKDVSALMLKGKKLGVKMRIADAILDVNNKQPYQIVKILESEFGKISKKKVLMLGLAFKPDTDDVRESPAIKIAYDLIKRKALLSAHDPVAVKNFKLNFGPLSSNINFIKDWSSNLKNYDIIIIVTAWKEYYSLSNFDLKNKIIFDAKRVFSKKDFNNAIYRSIGLKVI